MKANKLFSLLDSLSSLEMKWLSHCARSPYFNRNQDVERLVELCRNAHPAISERWSSKEKLFAHVFPETPFREQELYNLLSFAYRLTERFLAQRKFEEDEITVRHYLLEDLKSRRSERHFKLAYEASVRRQQQAPFRNADWYFKQHQLAADADDFFVGQEGRTDGGFLQEESDALDRYYFTQKLKLWCEMLNRRNIVSTEFQLHFEPELLALLDSEPTLFQHDPAIAIYHTILLTLMHPEQETNYRKLVSLLDQHASNFPSEEAREQYNYAQNYCIKKINQGHSEYLKEIFELYRTLLVTGIIYTKGQLTQWDYKNFVTVGIRLKEFEQTEAFIEEQRERLDPEVRDNAYAFNRATSLYAREEWRTALRTLASVDFTDVYYHLGARSLQLKIYYEQEDTEALLSLIEAFRTWLKRNRKVSAYQQKVHLNLIRFTRKAERLRSQKPKRMTERFQREVDKLKGQIENSGAVNNKTWLLQIVKLLTTD